MTKDVFLASFSVPTKDAANRCPAYWLTSKVR